MALTLAQMLALLPDNTAGEVTPADMRDVVTGLYGFTLIERQVLTSAAASFDFQNIPQIYESLMVVAMGRGSQSAVAVAVGMRFNNDSGTNYAAQNMSASSTTLAGARVTGVTSIPIGAVSAATATADKAGQVEVLIPGYARTVFHKMTRSGLAGLYNGAVIYFEASVGDWASAAAINQVTVLPSAGTFIAGSVASLYGIG